MSNVIDNNKEFFLMLNGGTEDSTAISWDGNEGYMTRTEAIQAARELADGGGSYTIFRCIPVDCVERGPVRVKPIYTKERP